MCAVAASISFITLRCGEEVYRRNALNKNMKRQRKTASYLIRVWQEPSQLQPPGEWRVTARLLEGSEEILFRSAADLWRYLTGEESQSQAAMRSKLSMSKGEEKHEK